jgi:FkbM family methyltransferase
MRDFDVDHASAPDPDAAAFAFDYPKEAIISYAQTREDVVLWRALHGVPCGFYIDIGAHDPTDLSVTRAFYDRGWRGINVEPNPSYAEKLRKERPRDVTLQVALGDTPGVATLYEFGDTGLSTLAKEIADGHILAGFKAAEQRVPVTTLAQLLDDFVEPQVHFLKIDVEGYEQQVLRGADFTKVRPWIVLIEAVRPMTTTANWEAWESILLEAGYEFVYFDGLNRFYIAEEHRDDLKRYFSVPVSICDPFRDSEVVRLSGEVARLTAVISDLHCVKHEVPRLGGGSQVAIACDTHDAAGLLRVVETQASDLVRLRRALVSVQTIASQRLEALLAQSEAAQHLQVLLSAQTATPQLIHAGADAREQWFRTQMLEEITRTEAAIADVIRWSRWRRIGQRLGLAKRTTWETGDWQTNPTEFTVGSAPSAEGPTREPSMTELLVELRRTQGLLDQLRSSRWRKIGHWLGLAKRLPWESGAWRYPPLDKPYPSDGEQPFPKLELSEYPDEPSSKECHKLLPPEVGGSPPDQVVSPRVSHSTYIGFIEYTNDRFLEECRGFATDVIFDIGANSGQFARGLRGSGYEGHIISFEPLSSAHTALVAAAASDPLWDVAERCAVGASDNWAEINIAGNSYSSSLLPMLDLHREAAPESAYQGTEACHVITLDSYIDQTFSDSTTLFGLKIDTQGYEAQVLEGLRRHHDRVKVIVCEMSLAPLYANGPTMSELCHLLADLGYCCVALGPEFADPRTGELLQVNGVFVKRR